MDEGTKAVREDVTERVVRCPECGALEGSPCGSVRPQDRGRAILGYHVKRTMRMRDIYPAEPEKQT